MRQRKSTLLTIALTALAFSLVATACGFPFSDEGARADADDEVSNLGEEPRGVVLDDPGEAPDFELVSHTGERYRLSEQQGGVTAIFFGYTGCPDVCPLTLSFMAYATEELGEQAEDVTFLLVTVDPERDDTERLGQYVERIDAPLVGLTGEREVLESVWADYDIAVERHDREDGNYLVDHSAQVWLVSPDGELTMFLPMGSDGDDLANDIRWLLDRSN